MNSLKNVFIIALLAAVGYGVYFTLNNKAPTNPPPGVAEGWGGPVQVDMPSSATTVPPFGANTANTEAPLAGANVPAAAALSTAPPFVGLGAGAPSESTPSAAGAPAPPQGGLGAPSASVAAHVNPAIGGAIPSPAAPPAATAQPPAPESPASGQVREEFLSFMNMARTKLDAGNWEEVHRVLTGWYGNPHLTPAESAQLNELLDQVAGTVIYSRQCLVENAHQVQPGETLEQIADSCRIPWELLAKINGIRDPQSVRPGQQLKVVRGPFQAVILLGAHELTLMLGDCYAGRFPIGIGKEHQPAEGTYVVKDKRKNPTYYGAGGITIDANDPNNPLGERWIGLGDQVGIHGTNDPKSVGGNQSAGSVCLGNRDIDDVFDILSVGSRVVVRR